VSTTQRWDHEFPLLFKTIIDQSADALFIVSWEDGQVVYANEQACKNLGYDIDEITRLKIWDYAGNIPDEQAWQALQQQVRDNDPWFLETYHKTRSGHRLPVEINARLLESHGQRLVVSSVRDISERKKLQEQLVEEKNKLEAVMNTIEDGITMQDPEFKVLYQNQSHKKNQGDQAGRLCYAAYHGREEICEGCLVEQTLKDGEVHKREVSANTKQGKVYFEVSSSPVKNSQGEIVSVVESVRDVTTQRLAENALRESARLRSDMISTAAHEFRTPLTTILGYAELLYHSRPQEFSDKQKHEFIGEIIGKAEALSKVVDQFLDMSRIEKGRLPVLERKMINVGTILETMINGHRLLFPDYDFNLQLPSQGPVKAEVDPARFDQVLENVLTNAIKYSDPGSAIEVTADYSDAGLRIRIADQGIGMTAEQVERIFEPFYRADPDNPKYRGLGLGMSLVKHIMEAHQGVVEIESSLGEGTTVSLVFPQE